MIPDMNTPLVLSPFIGDGPNTKALMAPYEASMLEVVQRFATSLERVALLRGLLSYRDAMRAIGAVDGYQWLNGSFVEGVEAIRSRPPADIDLVTFSRLPGDKLAKKRIASGNAKLFAPDRSKRDFQCDAYFVDLDKKPENLIDDTRYWFGLFSHQRGTWLWKGVLKVAMLSDDKAALTLLDQIEVSLQGGNHAQKT